MSNIGLQDTLPWGKHKGKTVEQIFNNEENGPGYLAWLRDTRRTENNDMRFFDKEVIDLIDLAIRSSKSLAKKFPLFCDLTTPAIVAPVGVQSANVVKPVEPESQFAYAEQWGAF